MIYIYIFLKSLNFFSKRLMLEIPMKLETILVLDNNDNSFID